MSITFTAAYGAGLSYWIYGCLLYTSPGLSGSYPAGYCTVRGLKKYPGMMRDFIII